MVIRGTQGYELIDFINNMALAVCTTTVFQFGAGLKVYRYVCLEDHLEQIMWKFWDGVTTSKGKKYYCEKES